MDTIDTLLEPFRTAAESLSAALAPLIQDPAVSATLDAVLPVIVLAVGVIVAIFLIWTIYHLVARISFRATYHVAPPKGSRFSFRHDDGTNRFVLRYPRWRYARKDGGRDRRRSGNALVWSKNELFAGSHKAVCKSPRNMMILVSRLRDTGVNIAPCKEEEAKFQQARAMRRHDRSAATAQSVVAAFSTDPTQFEDFTASLFRELGYRAEVTPKTNDGGFDIAMVDPQGRSCIVECKCYAPTHTIGRPYLQKLVGANETQRAQRLIFVTTSSFSSEAIAYAREAQVELIDGERLTSIMAQARASEALWGQTGQPDRSEWELSLDDVMGHYPPDYRGR